MCVCVYVCVRECVYISESEYKLCVIAPVRGMWRERGRREHWVDGDYLLQQGSDSAVASFV